MVHICTLICISQRRKRLFFTSSLQDVDEISMPPALIWKHDLVLLNVLDDDSYRTNLDESKNRVIVSSDGSVEWNVRYLEDS